MKCVPKINFQNELFSATRSFFFFYCSCSGLVQW